VAASKKIEKIDPPNWKEANIVQVDVRARNNIEAIIALDAWASSHGFARVHQNYLRVIVRPDGNNVYRGACYRWTDEERHSVHADTEAVFNRALRISRRAKQAS